MSTFGQVGADRLEVPYRPPTGAERREVLEQMRAAASPGVPPARTTPQLFLLAPLAAVAALAAWALGGSPLSVLLGCWLGVAGVFVVGRSVARRPPDPVDLLIFDGHGAGSITRSGTTRSVPWVGSRVSVGPTWVVAFREHPHLQEVASIRVADLGGDPEPLLALAYRGGAEIVAR